MIVLLASQMTFFFSTYTSLYKSKHQLCKFWQLEPTTWKLRLLYSRPCCIPDSSESHAIGSCFSFYSESSIYCTLLQIYGLEEMWNLGSYHVCMFELWDMNISRGTIFCRYVMGQSCWSWSEYFFFFGQKLGRSLSYIHSWVLNWLRPLLASEIKPFFRLFFFSKRLPALKGIGLRYPLT